MYVLCGYAVLMLLFHTDHSERYFIVDLMSYSCGLALEWIHVDYGGILSRERLYSTIRWYNLSIYCFGDDTRCYRKLC